MKGRKPAPTHLRLVRGDRKSRINQEEPVLEAALPMPPPFLSDEAKVEWGRISEELYRSGMLTNVDRAILASYCQAYGRWAQAEKILAGAATVDPAAVFLMRTVNGNTVHNPILGAANKAMADVARYAAELGMTPSARSRVVKSAPKVAKPNDPAAKYLS